MSDPVVGEWRIDDKRGEGIAHLVSSVHITAAPSRRFQPTMGEYTFKCGARSTGGFVYSVPARSGDEHCTTCVEDAVGNPEPPLSPYEATEWDKAETAHYKALADSLGFRRAVLELHAPTFEEFGAKPRCSGCYDSDYGHDDWPCETYVLARDWREEGK